MVCCLRCVAGSFRSPTGTVRIDFESEPNQHRLVTDIPMHIIDGESVGLVKLSHRMVIVVTAHNHQCSSPRLTTILIVCVCVCVRACVRSCVCDCFSIQIP